MKCKKIFALILSLCMIASTFVALPVQAATENVIDIDLPLDDASELTWKQPGVTASNADDIGGRNDVIMVEGLTDSNNNTAGITLPDGFAFQAGDVLTYSIDVYSESVIKPNMWIRNHPGLAPFAQFSEDTIAANTWTTIARTFTYDEMVAKSIAGGSTGAFNTPADYKFYIRPNTGATVYLDNLKLTVTRKIIEKDNVIDIEANSAADYTMLGASVTLTDNQSIGGKSGVVKAEGVKDANGNQVGVNLPAGFAFEENDILTYSFDVYSDVAINPDIFVRDHSDYNPMITLFSDAIATNTWTTVTRTLSFAEMESKIASFNSSGSYAESGNYAVYLRPRTPGGATATVYIDNFKVTVEREKSEVPHEHVWDDGVVTLEPTTETEGVMTYTCECGETYTETIEKLPAPVNRADIISIEATDVSGLTMKGSNVTLTGGQSIGGRDGVVKAENVKNANGNQVGITLPDGFAFKADDVLTYSVDIYSDTAINPDIWVRDHKDYNPSATFYSQPMATGEWVTVTKTATYDELVAASLANNSSSDFDVAGNYAVYLRPRTGSGDPAATVYFDNFKVTVSRKLTGIPAVEPTVSYVTEENGVYKITTADVVANDAEGAISSLVRLRIIPEVPVSIEEALKISFDFESVGILNSIGQPYAAMTVNLRLYDSVDGTGQGNTIGYIKKTESAVANFGAPVTLEYYIEDMENGGGTSALTEIKSIGIQVDMYGACQQYKNEANDGYFTVSNVAIENVEKPEHTHAYGEWVTDGAANHKKTCDCGDVVTEAHVWDDGVVTLEPTTEAEGVMTYTCECGETYTETIEKLPAPVNREDIISIEATDVSGLTMKGSNVTLTGGQSIGGRDGVVKAENVANGNTGIVGIKLPDGFAFEEDDILTYSVDVYSESGDYNPDIYVRDHKDWNPMAVFYSQDTAANAWVTVEKTVTYGELVAASLANNSSSDFDVAGNFAVYLRPRDVSVLYLDNFKVTVSRPVEIRGNIIDIVVEDASDITWTNGGIASDMDGLAGRDGVIALGSLGNSNSNTAGVVLADSFAFQEGDILTYSLDVYSDSATHPDLWLRNHGTSLSPFTTFYHEIPTGAWTTITKTVTYADLSAAASGWDSADKYALYIRPRETGPLVVYIDNFTVTVSRVGYVAPEEPPHEHEYAEEITLEATCGADGVKTFTCECGDTYTEAIPATGEHVYGEEITLAPTHTTTGTKTFTCACGDTYTEEIPADTEKHTYVATENEDGSITYTCECGATYTEDAPEHKHVWGDGVVTVEPTTEAEGVMTYTCACGETKTEVIPVCKSGDMDGDATIDIKDVVTLRRSIVGGFGVKVFKAAADVLKDGVIDIKDVVTIRRFVVGGYGIEL